MAVIALRGEIDLAGLAELQSAVEPHLAPGQTVVLDLSGVTFADSTLLKVLHQARGKADESAGRCSSATHPTRSASSSPSATSTISSMLKWIVRTTCPEVCVGVWSGSINRAVVYTEAPI